MSPLYLIPLSYLLGSIPTSWMVSRWMYRTDLTEKGSGNLGATNVFRVLGAKAALPVIVVDIGKGFVPAWYFPALDDQAGWAWAVGYAAAAILGHVYSVWLRFEGGKGVATSAGALLALAPIPVLAGSAVWIFVVFSTRIVSLASMAAAVTVGVTVFLAPPARGADVMMIFAPVLAAFVIWAHRSNIRRLLRGEENRFGRSPPESRPDNASTDSADGTPPRGTGP